ncbi:MAG: hypothetical protein RLY57_225 [Candidatus Parcubacteria bacterium]|jgi:hypothetical protein
MSLTEKIEEITLDHDVFNKFLYTPIREAVAELKKREKEVKLNGNSNIPSVLCQNHLQAVIFRHVGASNYELRRFFSITDAVELKPIILEYNSDRFTSQNQAKLLLGKLCFFKGKDSTGSNRVEYKTIIDVNESNNKSISEIKTIWGEKLVDFHHELLKKNFPTIPYEVFDMSDWIQAHGGRAKEYYKSFFEIITTHGILFENFMINEKEIEFTKNVVLPAFIEVYEKTGKKPLIVALEPTDIEGDDFWMCHPIEDKCFVKEKISSEKLTGLK